MLTSGMSLLTVLCSLEEKLSIAEPSHGLSGSLAYPIAAIAKVLLRGTTLAHGRSRLRVTSIRRGPRLSDSVHRAPGVKSVEAMGQACCERPCPLLAHLPAAGKRPGIRGRPWSAASEQRRCVSQFRAKIHSLETRPASCVDRLSMETKGWYPTTEADASLLHNKVAEGASEQIALESLSRVRPVLCNTTYMWV